MKFILRQLKPLKKEPLATTDWYNRLQKHYGHDGTEKIPSGTDFGHPVHSQSLYWLELSNVMMTGSVNITFCLTTH